jgi:sec-independent protein translocase protein TatA
MGLDNPIHIAFLLIILLLVFGAKRLPEMGRSLGDGMRGFKDSLSGESSHASLTVAPPQEPVRAAVVEVPLSAPAGAVVPVVAAGPVTLTPEQASASAA